MGPGVTAAEAGAPLHATSVDDETQIAIRDLFASELRAQAREWDRDGGIPASAFRRLASVGTFAARWPSRADRFGDLSVAVTLVRELALSSLGACIAAGIHTEAYFKALALCEAGERLWDDAIAGERIGALAITESQGGSSPTTCRTLAEPDGEGWRVTGHKHYVSNLRAATDVIVFCRTGRRGTLTDFTLFLVPLDAPGVRTIPHEVVGSPGSATHRLLLDGVALGDDRRVGRRGAGLSLLMEFLRYERLLAGVGGLAVAELCLEIALAFCSERELDGVSLREHPVTIHKLARMASDVAAGRALVEARLAEANEGLISTADAAQVKLVLSQTAWRTADEAVQLLGGRGFTEETPLARIWRDARISRIGGGTDEVLLELVGRGLKPGPLADHPDVLAAAAAAAPANEGEGA